MDIWGSEELFLKMGPQVAAGASPQKFPNVLKSLGQGVQFYDPPKQGAPHPPLFPVEERHFKGMKSL